MKNILLFDTETLHGDLQPLTLTRPVADLRFGILTLREKWEHLLPGRYSFLTGPLLSIKYPAHTEDCNLFIAGNICPDAGLAAAIDRLQAQEAIECDGELIAGCGTLDDFRQGRFKTVHALSEKPLAIRSLCDIFRLNGEALERDFRLLTAGRPSAPLPDSNRVVGDPCFPDGTPRIFIEAGAAVECAVLNVTQGPIYIGKEARIMENAVVQGPFAACEKAAVNVGSKIYGATTLGPGCKVGGEVKNVVMQAHSNKSHDGYLGNAVIGEWCNLGAGTNASNLKNDYSEIKLWHYPTRRFRRTGLQFCGPIMGDHTKTGINTMLNTATVLGVGVNLHGTGFPRNFVPSFNEGGAAGYTRVPLRKFFDIAERVMQRRGCTLSDADRTLFEALYNDPEL